jgi:hypothetical protein
MKTESTRHKVYINKAMESMSAFSKMDRLKLTGQRGPNIGKSELDKKTGLMEALISISFTKSKTLGNVKDNLVTNT